MKKKLFAIALSAAMLTTTVVPALAVSYTGDTEISGDNDVKNPIYNYQIPMKLEFAVDAFNMADANSQIYSLDFPIINKSNVAIQAQVTTKAVAKSGIIIKDSPSAVTTNDDTKGDIYLEAVAADTVKTKAGAPTIDHNGQDRPLVYTTGADTSVTFTEGVTGTSPAKFSLDLAGSTYNNPNVGEDTTYTLSILNVYGGVIGEVTSGNVADVPTATSVATAFIGKKVTIRSDKNQDIVYTIASAGSDVLELVAPDNMVQYVTAPSDLTYQLVAGKGTSAEVAIDYSAGNAPAYPAYNAATGAAGDYKVPVTKDGNKLTFVLQKASYVKDYDNDDADNLTLFNSLAAANRGVATYRFMGTVNPGYNWKTKDITVSAKYTVKGMPSKDYDAVVSDLSAGNAKKGPAAPSATNADLGTFDMTANASTGLSIPVSLGRDELAAIYDSSDATSKPFASVYLRNTTTTASSAKGKALTSVATYDSVTNAIKISLDSASYQRAFIAGENSIDIVFTDTAKTSVTVTVTITNPVS